MPPRRVEFRAFTGIRGLCVVIFSFIILIPPLFSTHHSSFTQTQGGEAHTTTHYHQPFLARTRCISFAHHHHHSVAFTPTIPYSLSHLNVPRQGVPFTHHHPLYHHPSLLERTLFLSNRWCLCPPLPSRCLKRMAQVPQMVRVGSRLCPGVVHGAH